MAFDGNQRNCADSLIPTYQRQAGVDVCGGINGNKTWSFLSIPGVSQQNQTTSYVPWCHNASDDPFDLINCLHNSGMNRKATDNNSDGENEGQISNILNGAHSHDSYTDRSPPILNALWSLKKSSRELMQHSQLEGKMQHNPNYSTNVSREAFSEAQGPSSGLAVNHQLLFNLANGDRDRHIQCAPKVPPGLPVPKLRDNYMSQIQQSKCASSLAVKERGNPLNNFPDFSDVLRHQSPCFDPYDEDSYIQNSTKSISNDHYVPQGVNQLGSGFESFTPTIFPNIHKQTYGMCHEDSLVEQWKVNGSSLSTRSSLTMQSQKQLAGGVRMMQRARNGVRKQILKCDTFQDHLLEDRQQPQPLSPSPSGNLPNQYQSKMGIPRESINLDMNQDIRHHILQGQIQNKVKPQRKKENAMAHMPVVLGESLMTRSLNNTHMKGGAKKQVFSCSPHFDIQGGSRSLRFDGENGMISTGTMQQCIPPIYPGGDYRGRSSIPTNFSSRSTLLTGDLCDRSTMNESTVYNSCVREMMTSRAENSNHGRLSVVMNKGGTVAHLYICVDECFEQWRCLERERKRTEAILDKTFIGKRTAAVTNTTPIKSPPNPTRVDHLLVKQIREQSKVASLLNWMAGLHNSPFPKVGALLNKHHMVICFTQARREEEMANMSRQQQQRAYITEGRDNLMIIALKELVATTRKLRTALWCALQMTLPKLERQENHGNKEAKCREGCTSPFTRYSFK